MQQIKFSVRNLYSEGKHLHNQIIEIKNGIISRIEHDSSIKSFDFECLAPALIDIHLNGGEKYHFTESPTNACLADMELAAKKHGTGYILPTLITSSIPNIKKGIVTVKEYLNDKLDSGILGLHLEGPFLNPKKRGAHLEKYLLKPNDAIIDELIKEGHGTIKLLTIAPELFTDAQLTKLLKSGIKISAGHSDATFEQAQKSFDIGINLVTHLYNAMSNFTHRSPGLIGASLVNNDVFTPIILDGIHVSDAAAKLAFKCKQLKLFLISDALFQNKVKTDFKWEEFDAKLQDGKYLNSEGNLAGGTLSLAECVKRAKETLQISTAQALAMATNIPAEQLYLSRKIGKIEIGFESEFCTFNDNLDDFSLVNLI